MRISDWSSDVCSSDLTGSQGSHRMLGPLCDHIFKVAKEKMHIITPDVGGGFGMKIFVYPETVLVLFAARRLGRPVRWNAERSEGFLRSEEHTSELQSLMRNSYAVFCLKKKKQPTKNNST